MYQIKTLLCIFTKFKYDIFTKFKYRKRVESK